MLQKFKFKLRDLARRFGYDIVYYEYFNKQNAYDRSKHLRPEFQHLKFAWAAMQKLLDEYDFDTILDIGCGAGDQSEIFLRHGKHVTAIDYGKSIYFEKYDKNFKCIIGDFFLMEFPDQFDCVWASHVLEHQTNAGLFLKKIFDITKENGVVCVTVPPLGHEILGGHVSLWNAGLLLYNLVLAGFDCREARILSYEYNISVIVTKRSAKLPDLVYDNGDVNRISDFLPDGFREGFDGNIQNHRW